MSELVFVVEEDVDGGYVARCLGVSIVTEAETVEGLRDAVRDAVKCHFDDGVQRIVRLHFVRDEVFAA
jgi:hypothetical protein